MISAQKLTKKFGNILALDAVTFDIAPGEFIFLTGPSGSGKTTIIRLIMRDLKPDAGKLVLTGPTEIHEYRRTLGTVFQDFKLLPDRSVFENVALPLEIMGVKPEDLQKSVKKALELVELTARTDLFPAQLSGGELQRVALARAIVARPKLILADEPTGNLDPKTARAIVNLLSTLHSQLQTTIIMATHNADIVNHLARRVIALDAGKVIKDTPKGKYD
ncbi:MAG: Cell division ATP-binding protein FtsE [Candidatus Amesbacteria bacterium GW2011_GWA2_47_11b]|uniref:Cell division ATP-binding protein FtsE n=3 Tax=Candidatus Amesiibacteriota TaxID=1752730 RepID=A0A0G1SHU9_9BACT|nr:MAG: Cell division ATP-binding protein FtsE [Microgenomates group bacterium GW2011_GWC1_46_20]KKU58208.1 MAG: Cell division ATP-binding protein FtsE [Candidatus Amesbacteria bacterium GW2011_GWA2_47_11b]KKU69001.1 MAG: Cell division ATP-binding protein FtsE [Candidatus Amesbacteria bacterium GW2011_GWA1_47_20]KKU83380.1 MAG: Cell division ATP-binding protein FtsE [Candidatus Amesbacteria bacterium GW2011_GWC2_47_8]